MIELWLWVSTVVPEFKPVKSRVVPEGTASADRMIVEQEVLDLLAEDAPPEPEKVQVVALLLRSGAAVGSGAGRAKASAAAEKTRPIENLTILQKLELEI